MPKDDPHVGCGIYPLLVRGWPVAACELHDKFYLKGSWAERNLTRAEADKHFLKMLLEISGRNLAKRTTSYLLYGLARLFGGSFWEGK